MSFVLPSNPADQKAIFQAIKNASDAMHRSNAEKEHMKVIADDVQEKFDFPKKIFNKMARTYYKANFTQQKEETEEFLELYETIVGTTAEPKNDDGVE